MAGGEEAAASPLPPPPPRIAALLARAAPGGPREALAAADGDPAAALALAVHALFAEAGFRSIRGPALALAPSAGQSPSASLDSAGWSAAKAGAAAAAASAGLQPSSSSSSRYAPPSGWCRRAAPDEWIFRYTHRAKLSTFVLHLALQRATGRMLVRAAEEEVGAGGGGGGGGNGIGGIGGVGGGPQQQAPMRPSIPMMPLMGGGGGPRMMGGGPAGPLPLGGGAAVGPPPSHNQRMLGLQLQGYVSAPAEVLRRCGDWDEEGVLTARADEALRGMVHEHLVDPLLEAAEDAPAYDEDEDGSGSAAAAAAAAMAMAAAEGRGGSSWWRRRGTGALRADRVAGAVAIGVGLAAIAVGVAYSLGPQRRARVKEALRAARASAAAAVAR